MLLIILTVIIFLLLAGLFGIMVYMLGMLNATRQESSLQSNTTTMMQQQLENLRNNQDNLTKSLETGLRSGQENISNFLTSSQKTFGELKEQIGKLKSDSERLIQISTDVRSLQDILKTPKLRGQMGEFSLAALLKKILPVDSFTLQHTFGNQGCLELCYQLIDLGLQTI